MRGSTTRGSGDSKTPQCVRVHGKTWSLERRSLGKRPVSPDAEAGGAGARVARHGCARSAARGRAPTRNRFSVPLFDCVFLKMFQLKCTE
jgi:hypothetical protein